MKPTRSCSRFLWLALATSFLSLAAVPAGASEILARAIWPANAHEYVIVSFAGESWVDAAADVRVLLPGYQLASVTSAEEQSFILGLEADHAISGKFWLGGYQSPDTETDPFAGWTWFDCEDWGPYENWGPGQPDDTLALDQFLALDGNAWDDEGSALGSINGYIAESTGRRPSGLLEIHYVNVQQAGATLVIGPSGATVMMDSARSDNKILPYLESIGLLPEHGFSYTLASHLHYDHIGGFDDLFGEGYDVLYQNWYNGSSSTSDTYNDDYKPFTEDSCAGLHEVPPVESVYQLGDGATLEIVAVHGDIPGEDNVDVSSAGENDKSVAVLIKYGNFEYVFGGDLTGGDDPDCTDREDVDDVDVEKPLAEAIYSGGHHPKLSPFGVDVLHVNHHGSDTSTNSHWVGLLEPEIAVISAGNNSQDNPEKVVVDDVLLGGNQCTAFSYAPVELVLQTDEGDVSGETTGSDSGHIVGDIIIRTDGVFYTVDATGEVEDPSDDESHLVLPIARVVDEQEDACPEDLEMTDLQLDFDWSCKALHSITIEGDVRVLAAGTLELTAADRVILGNGFAVEHGGRLVAGNSSTLDCS